MKSKVEKVTKDFFNKLDFKGVKIKVKPVLSEVEGKADEGFEINIEVAPEESGILIGFHGETISSLQLVLSHLVNREIGEWQRLLVNINDYRDRRNQSLSEMAKNAADQAKSTGDAVALPPMGSFDRRIIHMNLAEDKEVETYSDGMGRNRHIIISPTSEPKQEK